MSDDNTDQPHESTGITLTDKDVVNLVKYGKPTAYCSYIADNQSCLYKAGHKGKCSMYETVTYYKEKLREALTILEHLDISDPADEIDQVEDILKELLDD